jgi:hypothetical protein
MTSCVCRRIRTPAVTCSVAVLGACAVWASAARASLINLDPCNSAPLSQPFAPWGDPSFYELLPDGDFADTDWTLNGGAQLVAGGQPLPAAGVAGTSSLSMPAGSSAQSPATCVDGAYPTIRFFIAGSGSVLVDIVDGSVTIPVGAATATGDWLPTPVMLSASLLWGALSNGTAQVAVLVNAIIGDPQVDDVFIDPWNRG